MIRHVFVEHTGRRILPFGDAPDDLPILNEPLGAWRRRAFEEAGLIQIAEPTPPCLIVPDVLFTTGPILARFVAGSEGRPAVLALKASRFGDSTTPVQPDVVAIDGGWRFDAVRVVTDDETPPRLVWVDPEEQRIPIDLPGPFAEEGSEISLARHPVITLHHWVHLLWANHAAAASRARRIPWWRTALRLCWAFLRTWSLNKWRLLGKLNTLGVDCDVHPTATVEGCTLGAGVQIGPYARVLFSTLGDGARVLPGAHVEASIIGPGATVAQMTGMRLCVLYPNSFAGQSFVQASILGESALTTLGSYMADLHLTGEVRVPLDGSLHPLGTRFLGAAIGHHSTIGTGVWLAPGRAVPNRTLWTRHPDDVVQRVPEETIPDATYTTHRGHLVRAEEATRPRPESIGSE